jgi:hypothetical protein
MTASSINEILSVRTKASELGIGRERAATVEESMTSIPLGTPWQRDRLVDETILAYVGWREQRIAASDAYGHCAAAGPCDAALASGAYTAALDREEHASGIYAVLPRRVGDLVTTRGEPTDLATAGKPQQ